MKHERLVIEVTDAGDPADFWPRLRRWLKAGLRGYEIRVVSVAEVRRPPDPPPPSEAAGSLEG